MKKEKVIKRKVKYSIITTIYNLEELLDRAIESVLNQDYNNFEYIIVNDCSSDNSYELLKQYRKIDKRIILINNKSNLGLSASRNKALKRASGKYIVFLDGDDSFYENTTLSKIDDTLKNENIDICYFGVKYIGGSNKMYLPTAENSTKIARITCDMHFAVASKVWSRKFLERNKLSFIEGMYYEDMVFSIKAAILAKKLKFGSFPIYNYYRNREGSIMSTPNIARCKDMYLVLYHLMDLYDETPTKLQPYLYNFIRNETLSVPARIEAILKSLKNKNVLPVFPKRNYKYTGNLLENKKSKKNKIITLPIQNEILPIQKEIQ